VKLQSQIQLVFDTHQKLIGETSYTNPAGHTGYYEYIFCPVFGADGRVETVAGSTRDITHRMLNEETHGRLAAIIESSNDAIVSKDLFGVVTSWNPAAKRIFGYSAEEMVGQSILRIIPPERHYEEEEILTKIRAGQRVDHFETTRIRKDGERIDVSLTISPVRNSANVVVGTSKIARDISGRKRMEERLIQAEKIATMGRMAATIAHEVNNPLEALLNLVYLARCNHLNHLDAAEYLSAAEREIERISHMTRQTLGYYRDTSASVEVAMPDLIEEMIRVYQSKIQTRNIVVETHFDAVRTVYASKGELAQVLSNLISNSIDAMPNGGRIRLQLTQTNSSHLQLTIQDEGTGIPAENLSRIFEPFFTTKGNLGTGIGLWVTKQLVEKHNGRITVTNNDAPATGISVSISLPYVPQNPSDEVNIRRRHVI
jgi:PAS domain S-box-containing protein